MDGVSGLNDNNNPLEACICAKVRRSARLITQQFDEVLRPSGLRPTQFTILQALAEIGPVAMTPLANKIALDRTGLTRNLKVLERQEWVRAERGNDQRTRVVALTAAGKEKLNEVLPLWEIAQNEVRAAMSEDVWGELNTALDGAEERLRQTNDPGESAPH